MARPNIGMIVADGMPSSAPVPFTPIPLVTPTMGAGPRRVATRDMGAYEMPPRFQGDNASSYGAMFRRREAPVAPAPMPITPEPVAAPPVPAAPSSAPGGLGGLGGFGDTLEAVGYSIMTGGHGNLFGNFPQAMEGIRSRREAEAEKARKEQAEMAERQALGAALVDSGVFPSMEAASRYMASPDGLRVMMEARERQRAEAERAAMMDRARQMDPGMRGQDDPAGQQQPRLGFRYGDSGNSQAVEPQPVAPVEAGVAASDPKAAIQRLEDQIIQFESAAKAYEHVDPIMAAQRQAVADSLKRRRDLLAKQMPDDIAPTYGVIGTDAYGNQQYGWVDRQARTVTPAQTAAAAQVGESPIPPPPPGVDPATWRREQTERLLAEQNPQPDVKGEGDLRGEIRSLPSYENYEQARPIFESMIDAAQRDTKAADLNLVVGLGKLFDPTSVVREGEMIMVQNAQSLTQKTMAAIAEINGGGRLSPELRAELLAEASGRMRQYEERVKSDIEQFRRIAEEYGYDPRRVVPEYGPLPVFDPNAIQLDPEEQEAFDTYGVR